MNENITKFYEMGMERTVTVGGPNGAPAVKLKLLHAAAAAVAGVILAPRVTAVASIAALVKGVTVKIDAPPAETSAA